MYYSCQVTEKTDIYLDNIKCGLTLWEKLISLASDIEEWTTIKLGAFSEHHRFRNQQEITDLEVMWLAYTHPYTEAGPATFKDVSSHLFKNL